MLRPLLRALPLPFFVLACGSTSDGAAPTVTGDDALHPTILNGTASDDSQNAVVMLVAVDTVTNQRLGICTATMIASNLAITARHCVSKNNGDSIACAVDGSSIVGGEIRNDYDPAQLFVFTGKDRPPYVGDSPAFPPFDPTKWTPSGQGAELITDSATNLCNHDIALLRLKEPIKNNPVAAVRLDGNETVGEKLTTVGWGVSTAEVEPSHRQTRSGVLVKRVGPSPAVPVLTPSEFLFDESICLGDSGGPVFDTSTGAIVGVVSRGGNGESSPGTDFTGTCVNADNLATKLAPFKSVIESAYSKAGATPFLEATPEDTGCAITHKAPHTASVGLLFAGLATLAARRRGLRGNNRRGAGSASS